MKLCECGCGQEIIPTKKNPNKRFIQGHNGKGKHHKSPFKGKTYEQLYGDRAEEQKKKRTGSRKETYDRKKENGWVFHPNGAIKVGTFRKNKTYKEIYGDRAEEEKQKRSKPLTEEWKRKIGLGNKGKLTGRKRSEETRRKISLASKGRHHPPRSEETRRKQSLSHKGKKLSDEHRKNLSLKLKGKKNPKNSFALTDWDFYYQHGCTRSKFPYSDDFNSKLKHLIADRDCWTCQICRTFMPDKPCIHHIDYDKRNSNPLNLIFLCSSCHGKTNTKRNFWKIYFHLLVEKEYSKPTLDLWSQTLVKPKTLKEYVEENKC